MQCGIRLAFLIVFAWLLPSGEAAAQPAGPGPTPCGLIWVACSGAPGPDSPGTPAATQAALNVFQAATACASQGRNCEEDATAGAGDRVRPSWEVRNHIDGQRYFRIIDVAGNDVLNLRDGPGTEFGIIGIVPPSADDVHVGDCQTNSRGERWCATAWRDTHGWANRKFLVQD